MFPNNLRKIRTKKGISLTRLTQLTGIATSDICAIEQGRKFPFPGWRKKLAAALEVGEEVIFPEQAEQK